MPTWTEMVGERKISTVTRPQPRVGTRLFIFSADIIFIHYRHGHDEICLRGGEGYNSPPQPEAVQLGVICILYYEIYKTTQLYIFNYFDCVGVGDAVVVGDGVVVDVDVGDGVDVGDKVVVISGCLVVGVGTGVAISFVVSVMSSFPQKLTSFTKNPKRENLINKKVIRRNFKLEVILPGGQILLSS